MNLRTRKLVTNTICLMGMGFIIIFVKNDIVFYSALGLIFLFMLLLNFKACIKMVKQIMGKKR